MENTYDDIILIFMLTTDIRELLMRIWFPNNYLVAVMLLIQEKSITVEELNTYCVFHRKLE